MASAGGVAQGHHFGVSAAGRLGLPLADHVAIRGHQNATHRRIRCGLVLRLLGKLKGEVDHCFNFTVRLVRTFVIYLDTIGLMKYRATGLTLLELLLVLAMTAVVTSLAAPTFRSLWVQHSVLQAAKALLGDLRYARSEALKRAQPVLVCQSSDGASCTRDREAWAAGWLVFVDTNGNAQVDDASNDNPEEVLLRVQMAPAALASIVSNVSTGHRITYYGSGSAKSAAQTMVFTPTGSGTPDGVRALCISLQGRARIGAAGASSCS
jgi:type IV fimbrial biogenesis protein FimT